MTDQLFYDPKIERTTRRNNNRRRQFKEAQEVSLTATKITTNFFNHAQIQSSYHNEEVDMARAGEGQRTLGGYATFMGPLNFNIIVMPTIGSSNMEMNLVLIHLCRVINFIGYHMKTRIITWPRSWKFATW